MTRNLEQDKVEDLGISGLDLDDDGVNDQLSGEAGRTFADAVTDEMSRHLQENSKAGLLDALEEQQYQEQVGLNYEVHPLLESIEQIHKENEDRLIVIKLPKSLLPNGQAFLRSLPNDLKSKKTLTGKNAIIVASNGMKYSGRITKGLPHGFGIK